MAITTSLRLLKFSLSAIHLFAWPVIALGYPLFASIRAVENGSIYQMRKLVIYWILFSLFSLFEFAFVKILEWIPFWSSVRLVLIFYLVMTQFKGAWLAYQGLVRPVLLVKLQALTYSFFNPKEERLSTRETCSDVVENYINKYGSEALEKLIASESISSARVRNETYTITNVEEMTPPEASAENRLPETTPLEKTQQEWTCDLCNVTNASRSMLNDHLLGSRHKSKLESLKASLLDAIDTTPSPWVQHAQSVSAARDLKGTYAAGVVKGVMQPKEMAEKRHPEAPFLEKAQQEWRCDLCKVTTTSEITLNGHLQGGKHKFMLELTQKASKHGGKDKGRPSPSGTSKLKDGSELEKLIASKVQCTNAEVKETPPTLKKEWRCDLCKVEMSSEKNLNAHLWGSKHKAVFESLKTSKLPAKDTGGLSRSQRYKVNQSSVVTKIKAGAFKQYWCNVCGVKFSYVDVESHLKGKQHSSNINL